MNKFLLRTVVWVSVFMVFVFGYLLYLNKVNRAIESSTKLMLLPEKIPLRAVGDRFFVYILLNSQFNDTVAVDTVVKFDKDVLEALDVVPLGSFPTFPESGRVIDNEKGLVFLSAVNYDEEKRRFASPYRNIGLFGRISFQVKKSEPTKIEFLYDQNKTNLTNIIEVEAGKNSILGPNQLPGAVVE